jgi:hypothetical protein
MKKKLEIYRDCEDSDSYFVEGVDGEVSALMQIEINYPEAKGVFKPKDGRLVLMSKCLDCESWWINEDDLCGECGEPRLSKRAHHAYYFTKRS